MEKGFWRDKSLDELSPEEWEALCDGCGRCCLHSFVDHSTGTRSYTNVACRLLDTDTCRCRDYGRRKKRIPHCLDLKTLPRRNFPWLPRTCAYRLREEGKPLPEWHPLVSGDVLSVHAAGVSVLGKVISERDVHPQQLAHHLIDWID